MTGLSSEPTLALDICQSLLQVLHELLHIHVQSCVLVTRGFLFLLFRRQLLLSVILNRMMTTTDPRLLQFQTILDPEMTVLVPFTTLTGLPIIQIIKIIIPCFVRFPLIRKEIIRLVVKLIEIRIFNFVQIEQV